MPPIRTVEQFYANVETAIPALDARLRIFVEEYRRYRLAAARPLRVLDVGCGKNALLREHVEPGDEYRACDIVTPDVPDREFFTTVNFNEESLAEAFAGERFDVIFCGEVIEHLFSPDALLEDMKTLLRDEGILLLSTPNLAYWANRILLLFGVSPLFVENSANVKLGRRFRFLGQHNETQGHIRLFTYSAMRDLLELQAFELLRTRPVPVWNFLLDRLVCRVSPSLAPDNVYVARKKT